MDKYGLTQAMEALREGKRIKRESWPGILMIVLIRGSVIAKAIDEHYGNPQDPESLLKLEDTIYMITNDGRLIPWHITSEDALAEDYIEV